MRKQIAYITLDPLLLLGAFFLAYWIRSSLFPPIQPLSFYVTFVAASLLLSSSSFLVLRIYGPHQKIFSLVYLVDLLRAYFLWGLILTAFAYFSKTDYSRAVFLLFLSLYAIFLYLARFIIEWWRGASLPRADDPLLQKNIQEIVRVAQAYADSLTLLEGLPLRRHPGLFYEASKRLFDIAISLAGLAITLPFLPMAALAIKFDSPGKTLVAQERVGRGGKRFILYKLRTMFQGAELYLPAPRANDDPRITKVGKILRRYSIDELPQLWNVLRGEMSFVGPRPEMPFIVEKYEPWQKIRLEVKPGITGLWQILGRKDLPLEENLHYDLYYVYQHSFLLDLAIVLETLPALFFPRGAY